MKKLVFISSILMSSLLLSAQTYPFNENFDAMTAGVAPTGGWTRGVGSNFLVTSGHGCSAPNACSVEMKSSHTADTLITPLIGPVGGNTKISIQYRFVNAALYPAQGYTLGTGDGVTVDAYLAGSWHNALLTLNTATGGTTCTTFTYACSTCALIAGSSIQLRMDVARAQGDWYLDIDNIIVADNVAGIQYNALNPPALLVYPNPSTGNFTVWLKNYQANNSVEVNVYNYIGQKVKTIIAQGAVNNQIQVNSLGLEKGMYLVEVKSGDEIAKSKIQIE